MDDDFFPEPPPAPDEPDDRQVPAWMGPPTDTFPGAVAVGLVIGRSDRAAVMLTCLRVYPAGVAMTLLVRTREPMSRRFDLNEEIFDGPYRHEQDQTWQRDRFKWGLEFSDGRRVTSVGPWPTSFEPDHIPDHPVLMGQGGGGGDRSVERDYWLWPLPPAGPLKVICQWPQLGISATTSMVDADVLRAAASRAQKVWPTD